MFDACGLLLRLSGRVLASYLECPTRLPFKARNSSKNDAPHGNRAGTSANELLPLIVLVFVVVVVVGRVVDHDHDHDHDGEEAPSNARANPSNPRPPSRALRSAICTTRESL